MGIFSSPFCDWCPLWVYSRFASSRAAPRGDALRDRRPGNHPPRATVDSPRAGVDSPQATVNSPRVGVDSPQATVDSPRAG
eukprot:680837-Pyramimonas_sp.AAC.1